MRIITVLLILSITLISCENKKERIYREKRERFEEDCEKLITKYKPLIVEEEIRDKDLIFTVELEKQIMSNNGNSIYVEVELNDVICNDSSYIVKFNSYLWIRPEIYFTLDCERKLGDKILAANLKIWDDIAIIASISSVQKIRFDFECIYEDEYGYIEVLPSDIFLAKGKLIDFVYRE